MPPGEPVLTIPEDLISDANISFVCHAFLGRPKGIIDWFIQFNEDSARKRLSGQNVRITAKKTNSILKL